MKLAEYLASRGETDDEFAARADISRSTVKRIKKNGEARSTNVALKVISATGGVVQLVDLIEVPRVKAKRKRSAA